MFKRLVWKLALFVPFAIIILFLQGKANAIDLKSIEKILITLPLAIATFSISFSFIQYQFSPYKILLKSISIRHLLVSITIIITALLPLFTMFIAYEKLLIVSLLVIPFLLYSTLLLIIIAIEESNPIILLNRKLSRRLVNKSFARAFKLLKPLREIQMNELREFVDEVPIHDFGSEKLYTQVIYLSPFDSIERVVDVSLENLDIRVYTSAISSFYETVDNIYGTKMIDNLNDKFVIDFFVKSSFKNICNSTLKLVENSNFYNKLIDLSVEFLEEKSNSDLQVEEPYSSISNQLHCLAISFIEKECDDEVLKIASLFRFLCQRGLSSVSKKDNKFFDHKLPAYSIWLKQIGQSAINNKNSSLLYRLLEEVGYLGCTAIKKNHYNVAIECLQSLVQLGREARASNIRCFWRHCALDSLDHTDERLWWMLSWVPKLQEDERKHWKDSFEIAYSRLHGYKYRINEEIDKVSGRIGYSFSISNEKHIESFSKERYHKKIDYSDIAEIKEFKLY